MRLNLCRSFGFPIRRRSPCDFANFDHLPSRLNFGWHRQTLAIQRPVEHFDFNFSAPASVWNDVLSEMWHIARGLNLHLRGYIIDKADLIQDTIRLPAFMYHQAY